MDDTKPKEISKVNIIDLKFIFKIIILFILFILIFLKRRLRIFFKKRRFNKNARIYLEKEWKYLMKVGFPPSKHLKNLFHRLIFSEHGVTNFKIKNFDACLWI